MPDVARDGGADRTPAAEGEELADAALAKLSPIFDEMYADAGRPSIPPERLLKATPLMADGVALGLLGAGAVAAMAEFCMYDCGSQSFAASASLAGTGFAAYVFASPIIHGAHGRWGPPA